MLKLMVDRTLAQARWQSKAGANSRTLLFSHGTDLFAARRLHECALPLEPSHLKLETVGMTADFGQKIFIGLVEVDHTTGLPGKRGIGLSIDPETGMVEDLHNGTGVIGYVTTLPQEPSCRVELVLEAWIYGRTVIPRLWVGQESVVHPALLLEAGLPMTALAGGEINNGTLPRFDQSHLTLLPLKANMMAHG